MSQDTDRIPVPTNGRSPHPATPPPPVGPMVTPGEQVSRDQTVAFTPNQLAAGFGIVAGLLLLVFGTWRRRSGRDQ